MKRYLTVVLKTFFSKRFKTPRVNTIAEQSKSYSEILEDCRFYGLYWRTHIEPIIKNNLIVGYSLLNEGRETVIKQIKF